MPGRGPPDSHPEGWWVVPLWEAHRVSDANPIALDFTEARDGFRANSSQRSKDIADFEKWGLMEADAEHDRAVQFSVALRQYREQGMSVTEAEAHAKADVAHLAKQRDRAKLLKRVAEERISKAEADRAGLNKLSEWSMKVAA